MSEQSVQGLGAVRKLDPTQYEDAVSDLKNGELSISQGEDPNDITVDFRGDGVTAPCKVVARLIDVNPLGDPLFEGFKGQEEAAKYAAEVALRGAKNFHLRKQGINAETPIPAGELFSAKQSDLKMALAPFKGRINELRSALANLDPAGGMSKGQSKTIGNIRSKGRNLPTDPNI